MNRPCLDCGRLSPKTRCPPCNRARDRKRGTTSQRGYNAEHQRLRAHLVATYHPSDLCPKCGLPLGPDPTMLDLGHTDDRQGWTGLEHRAHNRATARRR
jgi:hypothetical protein